MPPSRPLTERFWEKVDKSAGCWLWSATLDLRGYGIIRASNPRRMLRAHRVAWELTNGHIPDGMEVCHRCDTPACVRPTHLFLGTHKDNLQDAWRKGRLLLPQVYRELHKEEDAA